VRSGHPGLARETGQALGANPTPLIIPCHRILAAGGKIGGFSAPGGSATKHKMLALEGVRVGPPEPTQQSFGF
jgi:methylated-DNA-[protein]-cysteine S-methyltransferase